MAHGTLEKLQRDLGCRDKQRLGGRSLAGLAHTTLALQLPRSPLNRRMSLALVTENLQTLAHGSCSAPKFG